MERPLHHKVGWKRNIDSPFNSIAINVPALVLGSTSDRPPSGYPAKRGEMLDEVSQIVLIHNRENGVNAVFHDDESS